MSCVSDAVNAVLAKSRKTKTALGVRWNASRQAVSNKFYRDYWSTNELVDIARFTGSKLIFKFPDGTEIAVETDAAARLSVEKAQE